MKEKIQKLEQEIKEALSSVRTQEELEAVRIKYIGRKGALTEMIKSIKDAPPEDRPYVGKMINVLKASIEGRFKQGSASGAPVPAGKPSGIDSSLPGAKFDLGSKHPLTQAIDEICDVFLGLGFRIVEGPEIETEYYNFTALNIPDDHPSRETFHTFFLDVAAERHERTGTDHKALLRSQTSTVQIRIMEKEEPPLQIIAPGKVFRPDATDASHSFMFHQIEGLMVNKNIKFSDLKGILDLFCKEMFGKSTETRFRPHFFPFTEPSVEVDVSCMICKGKGCRVCGRKGWLEILGAGMVNPKVFEAVGYSPDKWTGFAFGMGVERIAMLKWGIGDIRIFYENDLRFLKQF
ncbi:MAG: phenylalanine--tRNA ligase subunit alpha [Candidatus Omnitrophica bacterium]|nr:phenylalanine--tRNA ligase subunit alpha [Candidatus Omnitrophota bacterium]